MGNLVFVHATCVAEHSFIGQYLLYSKTILHIILRSMLIKCMVNHKVCFVSMSICEKVAHLINIIHEMNWK